MALVIDCMQSPSTEALRAAGVTGLCRYLSWLHRWGGVEHTSINPKVIQKAEFDRLHNGGFDLALNWEFDDHDWMGGQAAGRPHAVEALAQARALGYPPGCVILGSADFDMSRAQWDAAGRGYAAAFSAVVRSAGRKVGVYGPYDLLTWCRDAGLMDVYWQAGMSWAWSGGRNRNRWPGAHLRQLRHQTIGGIDCDVNEIIQAEYGQYRAGAVEQGGIMRDSVILRRETDGSVVLRMGPFGQPIRDEAELGRIQTVLRAAGADATPHNVPADAWDVAVGVPVSTLTGTELPPAELVEAAVVDLDALAQKVVALLAPAIVGLARTSIDGATIHAPAGG